MSVLAATSASAVVPGVLGFLVVAGMGVALFFLLRSLNKQLRKVIPPEPKWRQSGPGAPGAPDSLRRERQPVGEQDLPGPE
ncbi:MAG TPA: hypothetical protein VLW44_15805 [Streptosporangiaceae bacterium]|nr:hypothetical protein [Streptosporangiaceae bacterium]